MTTKEELFPTDLGIPPHITEALRNHQLTKIHDSYYIMGRPGTRVYSVHIACIDHRIVLTGDLMIGQSNGVISDYGYDIPWFAAPMSSDYLCSKFLRKTWQPDLAKEHIAYLIETLHNPKHIASLKAIIADDCYLEDPKSCDEAFYDACPNYVGDGAWGYGYDPGDAGWLCAIQRKFAELMNE